jgi:hypothetical protein
MDVAIPSRGAEDDFSESVDGGRREPTVFETRGECCGRATVRANLHMRAARREKENWLYPGERD